MRLRVIKYYLRTHSIECLLMGCSYAIIIIPLCGILIQMQVIKDSHRTELTTRRINIIYLCNKVDYSRIPCINRSY